MNGISRRQQFFSASRGRWEPGMRYAEYHPGVAGEIIVAAAGISRYLDEVTVISFICG